MNTHLRRKPCAGGAGTEGAGDPAGAQVMVAADGDGDAAGDADATGAADTEGTSDAAGAADTDGAADVKGVVDTEGAAGGAEAGFPMSSARAIEASADRAA